MDISSLTNNELINLQKKLSEEISALDNKQMAIKILLNSAYGAIGNPYFAYYSIENAESITLTGQIVIQWIEKRLNDYLNSLMKTKEKEYVVYGDTDSVVGNTIIYVNEIPMKIEDYFKECSNKGYRYIRKDNEANNYIIDVSESNDIAFGYDDGLKESKINYVMKHKVEKNFYEISVGEKSIVVTEDHSVMVECGGRLISVKPANISKNDIIIYLNEYGVVCKTEDFIIRNLGIMEKDVYDIEVDGIHNFFGNDILVHNSVYIVLNDLIKQLIPNETDKEKIVDYIDNLCHKAIEPFIADKYADLAEYFNVYENQMVMKREGISERGVWTGKKHYALTVWDNEGVRYAEPKIKIKGFETNKSSTPEVCRKRLKECLKIALTKEEKDVIKYISEFENEWNKLSAEDMSFPRGTSDISSYSDINSIYIKGTPIHVRASLVYNNEIKKRGLENVYPLIKNGDSIKFVYLNEPNPFGEDVIGCPDKYPKEFNMEKYIDYQTQFDKAFVSPIKAITDVLNWKTRKINTLDGFF